jgi:hypothetical protein
MMSGEVTRRVVLVEGGEARSWIVISAQASLQAKEAASILQTYLKRISGANLPIVDEKEESAGARIFVGQSGAVKALGVKKPPWV